MAGLTVVMVTRRPAGNVEVVMCDGQVAVVVTSHVGRFSFVHSGPGTVDCSPCTDMIRERHIHSNTVFLIRTVITIAFDSHGSTDRLQDLSRPPDPGPASQVVSRSPWSVSLDRDARCFLEWIHFSVSTWVSHQVWACGTIDFIYTCNL